jgi:NAD+ synthase (glutamine-hydrolysing)
MRERLRIAIAQINPIVGDLEHNRDKIRSYIEEAKSDFADIVVFPELAVCGYPPEDLLLKPHFVKDNIKALKDILRAANGITAIVGFADRDEKGNIYNAAAVMTGGKVAGVYRKNILPDYGVFDEKRYFAAGTDNHVFRIGGVVFGVSICEDIWHEKGPQVAQARSGAKLLFNMSASPFHAGKGGEHLAMLAKRARDSRAHIVYANLVGGQDELVFDGRSMLIGPSGKVLATAREFSEDLVVADIMIKDLSAKGKGKKAAPGVKAHNIPFKQKDAKRNRVTPPVHEKMSRLEEIYSALVLGTRDYALKNGFSKAVLGLSGGIDSSLTAVIARDALGKDNVVGLSMPSRYSSEGTKSDSKQMAGNLGVRFIEIPINEIFDVYIKTLGGEVCDTGHGLTGQNLQARIRGNILMAFSNRFGWLVLTTGNKSETAAGYCTLYGDMAGGYAVIKDVPKTVVYELARFVNKREGQEVIPASVIERAPSAELAPGQKDTDSLPPYDILDGIIKAYIEEDRSFDQIKRSGVNGELLRKVINMVDRNEYKRRQAPAGVKITPKAFGRNRRMPITNRYRGAGL